MIYMEYQCARCGSSLTFEPCICAKNSIDGNVDPSCPVCEGNGTMARCLGSAEWCEANPMEGREGVPRHTVEPFHRWGPPENQEQNP